MLRMCLVVAFSAIVSAAAAEPVVVRGGAGLGHLFSHRGLCWAILPEHVHGLRRSLPLTTTLPHNDGTATVQDLGRSALDLSLASVEGPAADNRCDFAWSALPRDLTQTLVGNPGGELVRVFENGSVQRLPVRVRSFDYAEIVVDVVQAGASIAQGWSGATLEIGGRPAGLAIESADGTSAVVLRMDAIVSWVGRFVEERRAERPAATPVATSETGIPFRVVGASAPPLTEEARASNLETGAQPYLTGPLLGPLRIGLAFTGDEPVVVRRVRIIADASDETFTTPRAIVVEIDAGPENRPRPRAIATGEMSRSGTFEATAGGGAPARRVAVSVSGTWDPAKPLRIDRIVVE